MIVTTELKTSDKLLKASAVTARELDKIPTTNFIENKIIFIMIPTTPPRNPNLSLTLLLFL